MTTLRRQRCMLRAALLCLIVCAAPTGLSCQLAHAATTELIVTDPNSGLAIYGYDPVAYFTDRQAKPGHAAFEVTHAGAAWRFRNEGNQAAFVQRPDVYMPQFGGHDPVGLAQHVPRAGHPLYWAIHKDRLFLFYSESARDAFAADPDKILAAAQSNWPEVIRQLAP
ncbi:YHS domain-containing (seleno)protein [Pseudorhodoplanes sp.]|uniref:YHS domain-containing (seleno)protein n=1 Tax=Pseudorhodoplanes sp. TaxID=1934341 RepID=UPI002C6B977B|nr:YHS domain-containing (seleno)protein [Pseudorhodoplanes sp.]HWV42724.1 YHS domain-containing (seleno)protein [Pseudorhodoplanes sp.]